MWTGRAESAEVTRAAVIVSHGQLAGKALTDMRIQTRQVAGYLLIGVLTLSILFGCRAFEPETVIVNKAPETYLTGAPVEEGGGLFHYHLFWRGTDHDGRVTRFVWALTDSTIQDLDTDDDEEDARFNPAVNINTLDIAEWTTRTDTIIDFQINSGSTTARDMTFHIVAVDDRGDFDRTPARLYFLSNTLGQPSLRFYNSLDQTEENRIAGADTIGYGQPFTLSWRGSTPNIANFTEAALAESDEVGLLDGLNGYKYRLPSDVICDAVNEDCWFPREFNPQLNRLASVFREVVSLSFSNDGSPTDDVTTRRLTHGVHQLLVNTIDVAGVEIPVDKRVLNFVVNYDPDTYILGQEKSWDYNDDGVIDPDERVNLSTDPFFPDDLTVYPYYTVYAPDLSVTSTTFSPGGRVPQRSVVTFKAVGWDDARDIRYADIPGEEDNARAVRFQGKFEAVGLYRGGINSPFGFETLFNTAANSWEDEISGASADTVSFIVGSFDYDFTVRGVDEHNQRDSTPDVFEFSGNYRPEVQCLKVVQPGTVSEYITEVCTAEIDTFYVAQSADVTGSHPDWLRLTTVEVGAAWVNPSANALTHVEPTAGNFDQVSGFYYTYELEIYAEDSAEERLFLPAVSAGDPTYGEAVERMLSCRYEITSHVDSLTNIIRDGTGEDDILQITYSLGTLPANHSDAIDDNGVWNMRVRVFVPQFLMLLGSETFMQFLQGPSYGYTEAEAQRALDLLAGQFGLTTSRVIARDASNNAFGSSRCGYYFWDEVRIPEIHDERCEGTLNENFAGFMINNDFSFQSDVFEKQYVLKIVTNTGEIFPPMP